MLSGRNRSLMEGDIEELSYLQAVVRVQYLRMHLSGPLLSRAHLCTEDVHMANGMLGSGEHDGDGEHVVHHSWPR